MTPPELLSTLTLLRRAFPDGISDHDLVPLLALMREEGEMSIRAVSEAMADFTGREDVDFLPDIDQASRVDLNGEAAKRIRKRLQQHGYEAWLRED